MVASTQTAGNNGTVNGSNGSVAFTDGAEKRVLPLKRRMAWIWAVAIFMVWGEGLDDYVMPYIDDDDHRNRRLQ